MLLEARLGPLDMPGDADLAAVGFAVHRSNRAATDAETKSKAEIETETCSKAEDGLKSLFLPPGALLIEIYPDHEMRKLGYVSGFNRNIYRIYGNFAESVGIRHYTLFCKHFVHSSKGNVKDFRSLDVILSEEDIKDIVTQVSLNS